MRTATPTRNDAPAQTGRPGGREILRQQETQEHAERREAVCVGKARLVGCLRELRMAELNERVDQDAVAFLSQLEQPLVDRTAEYTTNVDVNSSVYR